MCQAVRIMKTLNVMGAIVAALIIALAGIAIVAAAAASLLLVQSASATTDVMTTTLSVGGEEQKTVSSSTNTTTNNNVSNAALGDVFMIVEFETASVNPINETYIEIATVHNVTIIPPNATTTTTINATVTSTPRLIFYLTVLPLIKGKALS
jgi:Na+-transporting NADH:ubiquinone oxidoreductase subunit NqrC